MYGCLPRTEPHVLCPSGPRTASAPREISENRTGPVPDVFHSLDEMSDAVAHTTLYFAKRNFVKHPLVNPAGPVGPGGGTPGGGGLHDDHEAEES